MLIDGQWLDSSKTFPSIDPSTGDAIGEIPLAAPEHVADAVGAARRALPAWRKLGVTGRANALTAALEELRASYGEEGQATPLKNLISQEVGKRLPEADIEVAETADVFEHFIAAAQSMLARETLTLDKALWPSKSSTVIYDPVGVIAVVKPWNYPLELPLWSLVPALLGGNTVVFKPAEEASLVGTELIRILASTTPPGVLNLVTGPAVVGQALVDAEVDMVSFTGSVPAGRDVAARCGAKMRRCTMELGGNDAAIVLADADLEMTANGLTWGCFCNMGQVCVRPKRVFVHEAVAAELVPMLVQKTSQLRRDVDFGPLITEEQLARVEDQVKGARNAGASVLCGGERLPGIGYYFGPTILNDVVPTMDIVAEECFGPVMPVMTFTSVEEAIRLANDSEYGLGASVWTRDLAEGSRLAEALECGMVWVNDVNVAFPQAPWGGRKSSGIGVELGIWGLREYVIPKHISLEHDTAARRAWWYPY